MDIKEKIVEAITDAVSETFSSVLSLVPIVSEEKDAAEYGSEIIATIAFVGKLEGSIALIFSKKSACAAISKMLGAEFSEVSQDVLDGCGELANILAGGIKNRMYSSGYSYDISIPTVIEGSDPLKVAKLGDVERVELYVNCQELCFSIVFYYLVRAKSEHSAHPGQKPADPKPPSPTGDGDALKDLIGGL